MCERAAESVVVKQERELQEDVPSLDSPETQQVDAGPLGLVLPVKFEPDTDTFIKRETEIDIGPTVLHKPPTSSEQLLDTVKHEFTKSDGAVSSGDNSSDETTATNPPQHLFINKTTKLSNTSKSDSVEHTKEKIYDCVECQYRTANAGHLKDHMRTHTGEKPYSCRKCQYKCSKKGTLVRHMRVHTGEKPYSCNYCQFKCSVKGNLYQHMRTHTGEKPYCCSICLYKCSVKLSLVQHMRTHTGEKPYSCSICQYKSTVKVGLTQHMRTHTEEKPYNCSYCTYKCSVKRNLIRHMRTHTTESE